MQPLKDLLLIELDERKNKTDSGFYFKEAWESAINSGTVLEVGPEVSIKKDTKVVFNPYALLESGKPNIFLIKEADIIAIIGEENATTA